MINLSDLTVYGSTNEYIYYIYKDGSIVQLNKNTGEYQKQTSEYNIDGELTSVYYKTVKVA